MLEMDCLAVQDICAQLRDKEYAIRNYLESLERRAVQEKDADPEDLRILKYAIQQTQSAAVSLSKLILALEKTAQAYRRTERNACALLRTESRRLPDGTIEVNDLSAINKKMSRYKIQTMG